MDYVKRLAELNDRRQEHVDAAEVLDRKIKQVRFLLDHGTELKAAALATKESEVAD